MTVNSYSLLYIHQCKATVLPFQKKKKFNPNNMMCNLFFLLSHFPPVLLKFNDKITLKEPYPALLKYNHSCLAQSNIVVAQISLSSSLTSEAILIMEFGEGLFIGEGVFIREYTCIKRGNGYMLKG